VTGTIPTVATDPDRAVATADPTRPATPPAGPGALRTRFADEMLRPFVLLTVVALTAVEFTTNPVVAPALAVGLFVAVAVLGLSSLGWTRLSQPLRLTLLCAYVLCAAALFPLAPSTAAPAFPFIASLLAGEKLTSRRPAIAVGCLNSVSCATAAWIAGHAHLPDQWSWWVALAVGLPVSVGIARRDHQDALLSAQRAAEEAQRATESEARAAALVERGRIAREIHDVLAHSLSGIALQLDMAGALHDKGRDDEAHSAVRRARALAVGSINETRMAINALREDTLPLGETLRLMAEGESVPFEVLGTPGRVSVGTAQAVIRTAQEALTNAAKHAPGAARTMTLAFTDDIVSLTVANGPCQAPHPADTAGGTGMGLVGMRERTALLGGTLRAGPTVDDAAVGGGWSVELEVPK
jgi:signal transduction histidine kinase